MLKILIQNSFSFLLIKIPEINRNQVVCHARWLSKTQRHQLFITHHTLQGDLNEKTIISGRGS